MIPEVTRRAKRPCAHAGCTCWATRGSFCDKHYQEWQAMRQQQREEAHAKYLKACEARRENANKRGYNSAWNRARVGYLSRHPICVICGRPATEVDHIIPHKGDYKKFWDTTNWQSLCHECHSRKTYREVTEARKPVEKPEGIQPGDDMNIFYIK